MSIKFVLVKKEARGVDDKDMKLASDLFRLNGTIEDAVLLKPARPDQV